LTFSELIQIPEEEQLYLRARCEQSLKHCETALVAHPKIVIPFDVDSDDTIATKCDVRSFDWDDLGQVAQFDVILMDPPWKIQSPNGCRRLELRYELLPFEAIAAMNIPALQRDGFLLLWVVVSMFDRAMTMLADGGYRIVTDIN
jgi:mRNA (2'-O-methyladenosine-N6-)-methyltransferase